MFKDEYIVDYNFIFFFYMFFEIIYVIFFFCFVYLYFYGNVIFKMDFYLCDVFFVSYVYIVLKNFN